MTLDERREADLKVIAIDLSMRIKRVEGHIGEVDEIIKDAEKIHKFLTNENK